jgi:putative transposase
VVRPLAEKPRVSRALLEDAARQIGLSRSQTYELVSRYRKRSRTSTLLPWKRGRKPRSRFLDAKVEDIIQRAVKGFFLTQERPRVSDLMREIRVICHQQGLGAPNYRSVVRRLKMLDPRRVMENRFGSKSARQLYQPVGSSHAQLLLPLELVQIDHTLADVMVVDERDRLPIGRPWLTLAIDIASRVATGFYVSLDAPSTTSVAMVLTHAVLDKEAWLADRSLEVSWPVAGIPDLLHFDNAPEFDCEALIRGAQEYGIEVEYRPMGQPHFGGHIERLIGTMMGAVHLLPGTTFSSVAQKGNYPSEKKACLTLPELEQLAGSADCRRLSPIDPLRPSQASHPSLEGGTGPSVPSAPPPF